MALGPISAFTTRVILGWLRRRAYTPATFQDLAAASPFETCRVNPYGIGFEARLGKKTARSLADARAMALGRGDIQSANESQ
jgi:hypothetical protein